LEILRNKYQQKSLKFCKQSWTFEFLAETFKFPREYNRSKVSVKSAGNSKFQTEPNSKTTVEKRPLKTKFHNSTERDNEQYLK
jgi:hypothetical protein